MLIPALPVLQADMGINGWRAQQTSMIALAAGVIAPWLWGSLFSLALGIGAITLISGMARPKRPTLPRFPPSGILMNSKLNIDVYFDLICPWCLIGKRHLASALERLKASRPDLRPQVIWHSFPLLPDTPLNGLPYQEFYERRLGGPQAVAARRAQVREAGRLASVEFHFDQIIVMPNTLAAHRLIGLLAQTGDDILTERLIDRLFQSYFMEGRDIGDMAVLVELAKECGCAPGDEQLTDALRTEGPHPSHHDVSGVPYYVFNHHLALSGAQPPEILLKAMLQSIS